MGYQHNKYNQTPKLLDRSYTPPESSTNHMNKKSRLIDQQKPSDEWLVMSKKGKPNNKKWTISQGLKQINERKEPQKEWRT